MLCTGLGWGGVKGLPPGLQACGGAPKVTPTCDAETLEGGKSQVSRSETPGSSPAQETVSKQGQTRVRAGSPAASPVCK